MTWFKVDDKLHDHRKSRAAGKAAMGVWVLAGSWAADHLTDGFVPASILARWGTRADANKLVTAGLWHADEQDGERGWRFHQWNEAGRQPTRAEKLAEREARAAAGRIGGQASGRSRRGAKQEATAKQGASPDVEPPSRPVPTAAAAAEEPAATAAMLAGPIDVLRSKLQAHTPLRALRFDDLKPAVADRLLALLDLHGDDPLVRVAIDTCRNPPPVHVGAFLGTWEALPAPGTRGLSVVRPGPCTVHGTPRSSSGVCSSCAADQKAGNA